MHGGESAVSISITAVIPLYRVERYLPDLLGSLQAQRPGPYDLDLVFIDDGSPDASGDTVERWLRTSPFSGRLIRQENGGVSAARNRGLDEAAGEWITFPDSDDLLADDYFAAVSSFLTRNAHRLDVASARLLRLREPRPDPEDVHALSFRFAGGDRVVPMSAHPDYFQLNVASAFFRLSDLRRVGVRFRTGLHASEDALFVAEYLLGLSSPRLGLVASASYIYRRRASRDSAVDAFRGDPRTYFERFEDGYAPLMRSCSEGGVPEWLQSMFLYECQWLLPVQLTPEGRADILDEGQRARVLRALGACTEYVSESRLFGYDATALPLESRLLLQRLAGRDLPSWVGAYAVSARGETLTSTPMPFGSALAATDREGAPLPASAVDTVVPDYFGQTVLVVARITTATPPRSVSVDGRARRIVRARRGEQLAEVSDRDRRRRAGSWAISAREGEVRVWKPITGPHAGVAHRLRRLIRVARRHLARTIDRRRRGR